MSCGVSIHIGPHKTGSTYIQKMLLANRKVLASRGIKYPRFEREGDPGHSRFVAALRSDKSSMAIERWLRAAQRTSGGHIVLSSETFDGLPAERIAWLRKHISGDVRIIYFWRSGPDLLFSAWQEEIKHGGTRPFKSFLYTHFVRPFQSAFINPCIVLDRYAAAFGVSSLMLFGYDWLVQNQRDIFLELAEGIGLRQADLSVSGLQINRALPVVTIECVRLLNCLVVMHGGARTPNPRIWFFKNRSNFEAAFSRAQRSIQECLVEAVVPGDSAAVGGVRTQFLAKYGVQCRQPFNESARPPDLTARCLEDSLLITPDGLAAMQEIFQAYQAASVSQ